MRKTSHEHKKKVCTNVGKKNQTSPGQISSNGMRSVFGTTQVILNLLTILYDFLINKMSSNRN